MHDSNKHLKLLIIVAVVGVALGAALTVGVRTELPSEERLVVSYADLDVNTVDGATVLFHRIRVAAAEVCSIYDTRDLAQRALRQSCTDRAVVEAVAAVNNPVLSERYLANMKVVARPELVAAR